MIKECLYCGKRFKAPPSGKNYCSYAHFVYDHWPNNEEASKIIEKYHKHSLPSLEDAGIIKEKDFV